MWVPVEMREYLSNEVDSRVFSDMILSYDVPYDTPKAIVVKLQ